MPTIILDTNILMAVAQFKIDVFSELERLCDFPYSLAILDRIKDELLSLASRGTGRDKAASKLALQLINHFIDKSKLTIIKTSKDKTTQTDTTATKTIPAKTDKNEPVDDILVELSNKGCIIATLDSELKKRLKLPYITIRKKKYLAIMGELP